MSDFAKFVVWVLLILAVLFLGSIRQARADDYLTYTCCSWHAMNHNLGPKDHNFQETNHGIGLEHELSPKLSLALGEYSNSLYSHTDYLGVLWYPYRCGPFKFGTFAGQVTGYSSQRLGHPIAIPTITYQGNGWGINLEALALPPLTDHYMAMDNHESIFAVQFKVRIP